MSKKFRFLGFLILIFSVVFTGAASANSIAYRTHVTQYAWQGWVTNGRVSGTTGKGLQMEAIQIRLTDKMASFGSYSPA